ncbi:MAG: SDR family NAD(P)-dependent oxidoreductase [Bacteroidales bacterium]|nr:SDR family NAD(P)-dependent oxidoreductase [Bacteroidales bacterium]
MEQKIAIITGANGGMGSTLVRDVSKAGFKVIMACQSIQRATPTFERLKKETQGDIELWPLDLASFESIKNFVTEFQKQYQHIDLLLNNAGTLCHKPERTAENYEKTVGVNYLGHYVLTHSLLPLMGKGTRVVNMVSLTVRYGHLKPTLFQPVDNKHFNRFVTYSDSKKAFFYFTMDAAEAWADKGITVNCADPGIVSTNIIRMGNKVIDKLCDIIYRPLIKTPTQGASTMLRLALDPTLEGKTGGLYANKTQQKVKSKLLNSPERVMLRELTAEITQKHGFNF